MTDQCLVLTPEKVVLSFYPCGLLQRIFAHVIDLSVVAALIYGASLATLLLEPVLGPGNAGALASFAAFGLTFGYFVVLEAFWRGQTLGKRAFRARVLMADGTPMGFSAALFRNLMRLADMLPIFYLAGMVSIILSPKSQRLGDLASGTMVIIERVRTTGYVPAPHHVGIHRMESTVGDLYNMTLEEYHAIKRLVDRFPSLPPTTQQWSVTHIWQPFAERHSIQQATDVHPIFQMEAVVMKFGRTHNLI
ncbi:MAG: RDD family protein [Chthonomonadaceae bacterium]|nr:RDD family protein [Chthonomonadaceae bacterium]